MNLFDLFAKITVDTSGYEKSLSDAEEKTSSFSSSLSGGLKKAAKVGAVAVGAVTTVSTVAGKKILENAKATAAYGDSVDKMSQKVGMTTDAYQEWDYVLQLGGSDMASSAMGFKTLVNRLDEAANGSESAAEMFSKIGVSLEDINTYDRETLFKKVIMGFQNMGDTTERAALASDLLGRAGMNLAPVFNMTNEQLNDAITEAHNYGAVMSNEAVKQSATFQDRLLRMSKAMSGVKNVISTSFMPGITTIIEGFADVIEGNEGANEALSKGFDSTIDALSNSLPRILDVGGRIVTSLASGIVKNIPKLAKAGLDMIVKFGSYVISNLPKLADSAVQIVTEISNGLSDALPKLVPKAAEAIVAVVKGLTQNAPALIRGAFEVFKGLAQGFIEAVPVIVDAIPEMVQELVSAISENFDLLLPAAGLIAGKSILGGIISGVKDNSLIGELKDAVGGKGGIAAAVIGGVVLLMEGANKEIRAAYATAKEEASKLTESQQAVIDKAREEAEKWAEIKEKRQETAKGIDETVGKYKDLWDRLTEIVDEQGNIKKGYEEEAKMITGELSEALGIEIGIVDGQIQKYGELKGSIDEVITKKKAELMLKAFEEDYTEAIKKRTDARTRLTAAEGELTSALDEQKKAEQEVTAAQNRLNEAKAYGAGYTTLYGKSMVELETELAEAQGKLDGATEKVDALSEAVSDSKTDLKEAAATMTNYDDVVSAVASGSVSDMNRALDVMTNSIKTAKNATKEELMAQTQAFRDEYKKQTEAVKSGGGAAAREAQAEAKRLLNLSISELAKLDDKTASEIRAAIRAANGLSPKWFEIGKQSAAGIAKGFSKSAYLVVNAAKEGVNSAIYAAKKKALIASPSKLFRDEIGFMMGKGLALGMEDADDLIQHAAEDWIDTANDDGFADEYDVSTVSTGGDQSSPAGDIVINVYGAEGQNVNSLADEVAERLQRMYRKEVARFA